MQAANRILAALSKENYDWLDARLELITFRNHEEVYRPRTPIAHAYFPISSVCSALVMLEDGSMIEVGTVGNEGVLGLPLLHGVRHSPDLVLAQIPGAALRLPTEVFTRAIEQDRSLRDVLGRYTQAHYKQVSQSAACNRLHSTEQRCARWLLASQDRTDSDRLPFTHDLLGRMLGVRRETVTVALAALERAGAVRPSRGRVTITDRRALEKASCECYWTVRDEFDRLLGPWRRAPERA